jgi:hypothetical protein
MQIDIVKVAEIIGACSVILGVIIGGYKLYDRLLDHISDLERRMTAQEKELERMKKEDTLVIFALRACLDGLKQQGCNGKVTEAFDMLDKHINKAAHDQD